MAGNDPQPLGADSENFYNEYYDNSSQQLKRHIYINNRGEYDHDIADFIFKKTGYTCTYIVIHTTGIPNGVILNLCDENSNQLYSPVDTNKNWITTACSITVGETDIIPLPAQFNNELSNHVPFPVGTHNWKLVFAGNDYYEGKELPLTVEIRDFKVWDIQTPTIYPNEEIKVKVQTNVNTLYPPLLDMSRFLTNNATYDYETGVITYPNSDINDLTIGKHIQVINQLNKSFIDYEVKNPFYVSIKGNTSLYKNDGDYDFVLKCYQSDSDVTSSPTIYINNTQIIHFSGEISSPYAPRGRGYKMSCNNFPPGTYQIEMTGQYNNTNYYTAFNEFEITTEDCHIILTSDTNYIERNTGNTCTFIAQYQHNNTPIPNATIGFFDNTGILKYTTTTDSNGQAYYTTNQANTYIAKALQNNKVLLESNICKIYDVIYISDLNINNQGNLLVSEYVGEYDITELVNDIIMREDANLYVSRDINDNQNVIVINVNVDEDGNLIYTNFGDI